MSRSFERKIIFVASAWQIITGLITIFFYSFYIKSQGNDLDKLSQIEAMGVRSIFDNLFTFTVTYGLFFVVIASLNIIFVRKLVKDDTIQYKMPFFWICLSIVFFFLSDFISVMLCSVAAVIALSKNKPLKLLVLANKE